MFEDKHNHVYFQFPKLKRLGARTNGLTRENSTASTKKLFATRSLFSFPIKKNIAENESILTPSVIAVVNWKVQREQLRKTEGEVIEKERRW